MSQRLGNCHLCGNNDLLQVSHLLPKALYRFVRASHGGKGNPDLVYSTKTNSWLSSRQVTANLLCLICEQLFNKNGEGWVLNQCYRGKGSFKLQDTLRNCPPLTQSPDSLTYTAAAIPSINVTQLVYFASSVFWRASVPAWQINDHELKVIDLGPKYEKQFLEFLQGREGFPSNAALRVGVSPSQDPRELLLMIYPYGGRREGYHQYRFAIPGLRFDLFLGNAIPPALRERCILRSTGNLIFLTSLIDEANLRDMESLISTSKPSERLKYLS